jgi:hypothetical protein
LLGEFVTYSAYGEFNNPVALLLVSTYLEIGAREGARVGIDRCQTITLHSLAGTQGWAPAIGRGSIGVS